MYPKEPNYVEADYDSSVYENRTRNELLELSKCYHRVHNTVAGGEMRLMINYSADNGHISPICDLNDLRLKHKL